MRFAWRIVDSPAGPSEFHIVLARGAILPGERQAIRVEMISKMVTAYSAALILDMPGVQEGAHRIPLTARCVVPQLSVADGMLDFGACFLQHPETRVLTLRNESALPAKFEVGEQEAAAAALARFEPVPASGAIPPEGAQCCLTGVNFLFKIARDQSCQGVASVQHWCVPVVLFAAACCHLAPSSLRRRHMVQAQWTLLSRCGRSAWAVFSSPRASKLLAAPMRP